MPLLTDFNMLGQSLKQAEDRYKCEAPPMFLKAVRQNDLNTVNEMLRNARFAAWLSTDGRQQKTLEEALEVAMQCRSKPMIARLVESGARAVAYKPFQPARSAFTVKDCYKARYISVPLGIEGDMVRYAISQASLRVRFMKAVAAYMPTSVAHSLQTVKPQ